LLSGTRDGSRTRWIARSATYWAAATIWLALIVSVLDGSIANVPLPTNAGDLSAPAAEAVWVVNAYQLAIVVSLLPMAAIGEMVGFRRVFQLGVIVFTLGSLGCTFAHSLPTLAFARRFRVSAQPGS
jgi:DHA2 family multidrug resistance protein-like MFS transporter